MNLRIRKKLLTLAVSAGLGAVSLPVLAAGPTVYGDLALAYHNESPGTSGLSDNVSLLGVKGDAAVIGSTKYFYDFNFILDTAASSGGAVPTTHLGILGVDAPWGTVTAGRDNGLFSTMVDGSTYATNWFYTPGMSSLQVGSAITYKTKSMSGFQVGVQAFDIGNTGTSTTNSTLAASYAAGPVSVGLGAVSYADIGAASSDTNQFGDAQNVYSGVQLSSKTGASIAYKIGSFNAVLAYDVRKPVSASPNTNDINTSMLTGTYAVSSKTTLAADYSSATQSGGGVKGTILTLMASYAPADNLFYSLEYQSSNADANASGLTGATGGTGGTSAFALGMTYSF